MRYLNGLFLCVGLLSTVCHAMQPGKQLLPPTEKELKAIAAGCRCKAYTGSFIPPTSGMNPVDRCLWVAAGRGDYRTVRQALAGGANPNAPNLVADGLYKRETAFHRAIQSGKAWMMALLWQHGASLEQCGPIGESPLCMAAWCECRAVLKMLLRCGASADKPDERGVTPLISACWSLKDNADRRAALLLAWGADPNKELEDLACEPGQPGRRRRSPLLACAGSLSCPGLCELLCADPRTRLLYRNDAGETIFRHSNVREDCRADYEHTYQRSRETVRRALAARGRELVYARALLRQSPGFRHSGPLVLALVEHHIGPFLFNADDLNDLMPAVERMVKKERQRMAAEQELQCEHRKRVREDIAEPDERAEVPGGRPKRGRRIAREAQEVMGECIEHAERLHRRRLRE